ncbi:MAG: DUF3047 domain-containing protein [Deltaproteobacteria bacterium]|nr:DUF3047 domain-containing protein [Deltaproteobacteria bacterium]
MRFISLLVAFLAALLTAPHQGRGDGQCLPFSFFPDNPTGLPRDWKPLTFPKISRPTTYRVEGEAGNFWVKAESDASASALLREVQIDPKIYPILRWRWKVENIIEKGDERKKEGDDYAARVYVNFRYDSRKASLWERTQYAVARTIYGSYPPKGAINYIWANRLSQGKVIDNAYTSRAKMIAVESGPQRLREWVNEERNIYQDYRLLFGGEPPPVIGIAVMTDTDNTGETAIAHYGEISFCRK